MLSLSDSQDIGGADEQMGGYYHPRRYNPATGKTVHINKDLAFERFKRHVRTILPHADDMLILQLFGIEESLPTRLALPRLNHRRYIKRLVPSAAAMDLKPMSLLKPKKAPKKRTLTKRTTRSVAKKTTRRVAKPATRRVAKKTTRGSNKRVSMAAFLKKVSGVTPKRRAIRKPVARRTAVKSAPRRRTTARK
jgi:asparagine synthetase B (glutamine-hydrolysing)